MIHDKPRVAAIRARVAAQVDLIKSLEARIVKGSYYLSKQLSNQYVSVQESSQFREALSVHCRQASKIVEQFAGDWYSKANYEGGITPRKAANFVYVALRKLRAELDKGAESGRL